MAQFVKIGERYYNLDHVTTFRVVKLPDADGKGGHVQVYFSNGQTEQLFYPDEIDAALAAIVAQPKTDTRIREDRVRA